MDLIGIDRQPGDPSSLSQWNSHAGSGVDRSRILFEQNGDIAWIDGLSQMMTALIASEQLKPETMITSAV